ncbi:MAG: Fic family protein [bacterium]
MWTKAALYLCRIAQSQAFIDGNKRTAFQAADTLLYMNGFVLHPPSTARTVQYILAIARKERTRENARYWLRRHSSQAGWTALVP